MLRNSLLAATITCIFYLNAQEPVVQSDYSSQTIETLTLCQTFMTLAEKANDGFDGLIGEEFSDPEIVGYIKKPLFKLENAEKTYFHTNTAITDFKAAYGKFSTYNVAWKKAQDLMSEFKQCINVAEFSKSYNSNTGETKFNFYFNTGNGLKIFDSKLVITYRNSNYYLNFEFRAHSKYYQVLYDRKSMTEYFNNPFPKSVDQTSEEIRSILRESSNGFKAIKGEILQEYSSEDYFKTTLPISNMEKCFIKRINDSNFEYIVKCYENVPANQMKEKTESVAMMILNALGPGYAYSVNANNTYIDFINTNSPFQPIIVVKSEKNVLKSFDINLTIK